jgi:hypothetical protein
MFGTQKLKQPSNWANVSFIWIVNVMFDKAHLNFKKNNEKSQLLATTTISQTNNHWVFT